ncbi:MAG TPA: hypothetical protein VF216_01605 [Mizugakiibacter sp.]
MSRNTVLAFALGALLAGGLSYALAEPPAPMADAGFAAQADGFGGHHGAGIMRMRLRGAALPARAAIGDLHRIERLYLIDGRAKDLPALYKDVLAKTQNPVVRNYAYRHLAHAQLKPANVDQAIATLKQSLDEDLARLNKTPAPERQ